MTETNNPAPFLFQIFKLGSRNGDNHGSDEVTYGQYCTFSSNFGHIHPQTSDFVHLSCNFGMLIGDYIH